MIEIDIDALIKTEKKIKVKATARRKGHYRIIKGADVGKESFKDIKSYPNAFEFVRKNVKEMMKLGIKDMQAAEELFNRVRMERFVPKEPSLEEATSAITGNIRDSILEGWFRGGDRNYKIHIFNAILNNDDVKNGTLKCMHHIYQVVNDSDISFDKFINTDIKVYRGGSVGDDVFTSFTLDKGIAERFAKEYHTDMLTEITVKPIDTLGCGQTTGEAEVMLPKALLDDRLDKSETKLPDDLPDFDKFLISVRLEAESNRKPYIL